jgi:hypothetical protein
MSIPEIADARAPRQGADKDQPEGSVVISETVVNLVNLIIKELRKGFPERPSAEYFDSSVSE